MSVIAAVRKGPRIIIAADTQDNFGDLRPPAENHEAIKLREVGGAVLGSSGWALYDDIFEHYLTKRRAVSLHDHAGRRLDSLAVLVQDAHDQLHRGGRRKVEGNHLELGQGLEHRRQGHGLA